MDLLLHTSEDPFNCSIVFSLLDDTTLFVSLHRHLFNVPALVLELADFTDVHLQTDIFFS